MSEFRTVVGLEVHVQLLTKSKLFCGCSVEFGQPPNSAVCPVCLGMPGVLPVMNRKAFELSLRAALALNCQIAPFTKWDRKNYYYPDLPKDYQISQYDLPFSIEGYLEIPATQEQAAKRIGIFRAHLEEDAGKSMHDESGHGGSTKVDLNRAGTPLLEIVSKPEITNAEDARMYLEELRLLLKEAGISDCEMQEGSLRCDANVNIHMPTPDGGYIATPIVEVKNLNSFRGVERAIRYEAQRQYEQFQKDGKKFGEAPKCTAGWDDARGVTIIQRRKEEASDYRYFPEPDLAPVRVTAEMLEEAKASLGELPHQGRARLQAQHGLGLYDADILVRMGRAVTAYFEKVVSAGADAKGACNWVINQVLATLNEQKITIDQYSISADLLAGLVNEVQKTGLNMQRAREVYAAMLADGIDAAAAIKKLGFVAVADEGALAEMIRKAMAANPKAVADYKAGKLKAADALKGSVMKETKGMAKSDLLQKVLLEELAKV
jgi:aspartyl-tRNA(Asn)/glutamyl-tRNA(Gln) amidotransferase subunit B